MSALADMRYDICHAVADRDLVAVNATMNRRHVAPWLVYTHGGAVNTVFPTNKTFATTQSHWFLLEDCKIVEHWASATTSGWPGNSAGFRRPRHS